MNDRITVCIPSIPTRKPLLHRAVSSVLGQTRPAHAMSIVIDHDKEGAPATRQRALMSVRTPYVAFLDDDDEFMLDHLEKLFQHMQETGADYVYSWFKIVLSNGRVIDRDLVFGEDAWLKPFDYENPKQTTVTTLVRTDLAKSVGFCDIAYNDELIDGNRAGEDYQFTCGCVNAGAKISHLVDKTWFWHHDSRNTMGMPENW